MKDLYPGGTSPCLEIRTATPEESDILAHVIRLSNLGIAREFGLTRENCPKHPSHCTGKWIKKDLARGIIYYILLTEGSPSGCAALETADAAACYLERLAVLPEYRHNGYGKKLVDHLLDEAKAVQAKTVGIGIIAQQTRLRQWYESMGFIYLSTRKFDHLPFQVGFMEKKL